MDNETVFAMVPLWIHFGTVEADAERFEYKLVATTKTSTMEKELKELADAGYQATGLTVGKTALGGSELVVITRRKAK